MTIRPVRDLEELADAYDVAGGAVAESPSDRHDWRFDAVRDAFPRDRDVDLVAVEGDDLLGAVLCFRDEGGVRARTLGLRPDARRRGLGTALVRALLEAAWTAGDRRVHLGAVPSAVGFYEACGFTVREVLDCGTTVMESRHPDDHADDRADSQGGLGPVAATVTTAGAGVTVRRAVPADDTATLLRDAWCGDDMVVDGRVLRLADLDSFVAVVDGRRSDGDGGAEVMGVLTYDIRGDDLEIVSCHTLRPGVGIGRALVAATLAAAREAGVRQVTCTTTNDNVGALAFWQRMGLRLHALRPGAVDRARAIKPSIPLVGEHGIELHDEIELRATVVDLVQLADPCRRHVP